MRNKIDKRWVGAVFGLIGPWIGFWIYSLIKFPQYSFSWSINLFITAPMYQSSLMSLSLIFNFALFFLFIWLKYNHTAKGILAATFIYAPFVIYFRFS